MILVVDDSAPVAQYLSSVLASRGHCCVTFTDAASVLRYLAEEPIETALIISDIGMPVMDGIELLKTVRQTRPELPFILLSGRYEESIALEVLGTGASDYLLKPALPDEIMAVVNRHLTADDRDRGHLRLPVAPHLAPLIDMLGFRRFETLQHSQRVAAFCLLIAEAHGVNPEVLASLEAGALLHDVGKAAIPHNVLMKEGPLSEDERRVIEMHPRIGYQLISAIPGGASEAEIAFCHHERFDGRGYPRGLAGAEIPLNARIFTIADALDAICSDRAYRAGSTIAAARIEIARNAGTHFDPALAASFSQVSEQSIQSVQERFPDEEKIFRKSLIALNERTAVTEAPTQATLTTPSETRRRPVPLCGLR